LFITVFITKTNFHPYFPIILSRIEAFRDYRPSVLLSCWLDGRKGISPVKKIEWWDAAMVISKSRLVLPFRYWLTWVVLDKGPLNGCCCK